MPQEPIIQEDPKEKLYNTLKTKGYYTKSYDEFKQKYSSQESIDKIYDVVSRDGLYTKTKDEFYTQYFPPSVEKKNQVGNVSANGLQAGVSPYGVTQAGFSATPTDVSYKPVPEEQLQSTSRLKIGATDARVGGDIGAPTGAAKTVAGVYNTLVGSVSRLAGGLGEAAQRASVGWNPYALLMEEGQMRKGAVNLIDKARSEVSTKEDEAKARQFDVTDGVSMDDVKGLLFQAPSTLLDMAAGALTGGGSFVAQAINDASEELDSIPEAQNLNDAEKMGYIYTNGLIQGALERLGLNKILKSTGASKFIQKKIAKEITEGLIAKGEKATADQIEKEVIKRVSGLSNQIKTKGVGVLKSIGWEGGTEATQQALSDLSRITTNELSGTEIFNEQDITENFLKNVINAGVQGGAMGGLFGGANIALSNNAESIKSQINSAETQEQIDEIKNKVNEEIEKGSITKGEAIVLQDESKLKENILNTQPANEQQEAGIQTTKKEKAQPQEVTEAVEAAKTDIKDEVYRNAFTENPDQSLKEIAQQLNSSQNEADATRRMFGDRISDIALKLYPQEKVGEQVGQDVQVDVQPQQQASKEQLPASTETKSEPSKIISDENKRRKEESIKGVEYSDSKDEIDLLTSIGGNPKNVEIGDFVKELENNGYEVGFSRSDGDFFEMKKPAKKKPSGKLKPNESEKVLNIVGVYKDENGKIHLSFKEYEAYNKQSYPSETPKTIYQTGDEYTVFIKEQNQGEKPERSVATEAKPEIQKPETKQKKSVLETPIEEVSIDDILNEIEADRGLPFKDVSNKDIKGGDTKSIDAYNQRAERVLRTLYPNAEFKALNTTQEYQKATGRSGEAGVLIRGKEGGHKLFLNLEAIRSSDIERTATHEVIHALVSDAIGAKYSDLRKKWDDLLPKLYNVKGFEVVKEHLENYSSADRPVEGITDLLANIVHDKIKIEDIPKNLWDEFIELVNRAFEAIGLDYKITPDTFNGFAQSVKEAFETGNFENLKKFTSKSKTEKFFKEYPEFAEVGSAMVDQRKIDLLKKKVELELKAGNLTQDQANKIFEKAGIKPPTGETTEAAVEDSGGLDDLVGNIPMTDRTAEYMSKDTIRKYTGEDPANDQARDVMDLLVSLEHSEKVINEAERLFGKDYVEKTLDYLENSKFPPSNKALVYVALENALGREKLENPSRAAEITKQQELVYSQSQLFARELSKGLNYQKLRRIARTGYDIRKVTDSFFSDKELEQRDEIEKSIEADGDKINKAAEELEGGITPEMQKLIDEGVEKEINSIYEQLPSLKKSFAEKAIKAIDEIQKKLRGKAYSDVTGVVAMVDFGFTVIKRAIKLGATVADAVEVGIKKMKDKFGDKKFDYDKFKKDATDEFNKYIGKKKLVRDILIEQGFGREFTVKGETKKTIDWKKLAGKAGTVSKISENTAKALKDKGFSEKEIDQHKDDFIKEYIDLRAWVIERAQVELAKRNKETVTSDQKSAAKKLAELYTYGLFEKNSEEFELLTHKALGTKVSEQGFKDARDIAHSMEIIYANSFKGVRLSDISAKAALEKLEDKLRVLLFREAKKHGNWLYKGASIVRNLAEVGQTMLLNNLKQATENPFSGLQQKVIENLNTLAAGQTTKELSAQNRKLMKDVYKDMVLKGGFGYGKVESQFVNRQHIDDYVNKLSDNEIYHGIMSVVTGKATLNAMDAMYKAGITEKKFTHHLITLLTHETNPNKMSKKEALKFVSESLTGQSFAEAQKTAKQIITQINKDAGKELIPSHQEMIDRFANDIVKAALEMGGKITPEQIKAAYGAAYKGAGLGIGHEANNILSAQIKGFSARIEGEINNAIKNKEWNRAAALIMKGVIYRNIINPFVGGGTNWLVLKLEKTGLGLFTGLAYKIGSKQDIDLSSASGLRKLEGRLYNQTRWKDNIMRGLVGGAVTWGSYALFLALADTDEYKEWRKKNRWATRYLDIITPEPMLLKMALDEKEPKAVERYINQSFNRGDAFSAEAKAVKGLGYAAKGDMDKAYGAWGEMIGSKANAPIPWRLFKDGQVLYQGIRGQDPYHGDYRPSSGFANGLLQGGVIEWMGARPKPQEEPELRTATIKQKLAPFKERKLTEEEYKKYKESVEINSEKLYKEFIDNRKTIWVDNNNKIHLSKEGGNITDAEKKTWKSIRSEKLTNEQKKSLDQKVKEKVSDQELLKIKY